jgi:hypothetical protein
MELVEVYLEIDDYVIDRISIRVTSPTQAKSSE